MTVSKFLRWTVQYQNTKDGGGDVIIDLPTDLLTQSGLGAGDVLSIEVVYGSLVLRSKPNKPTFP